MYTLAQNSIGDTGQNNAELGMRQLFKLRDNDSTTKRQWKSGSGTRQNSKNIKFSVTRWSCHNEYSNNAITNNFVAWKQGHVVAAVLWRAQLSKTCTPERILKY